MNEIDPDYKDVPVSDDAEPEDADVEHNATPEEVAANDGGEDVDDS